MAAPSVTNQQTGATTSAGTSHSISLASGTSDKLIIICFISNPGSVSLTNWTQVKSVTVATAQLYVFARAATSDTSVSVTTGNSVTSAWVSALTDGDIANAVFSTGAVGVDPDSVSVSSGDYRVAAILGISDSRRPVTAYPTNYSDNQIQDAQSSASVPGIAFATRGLTGITSEDPGTFTIHSSVHAASSVVTMAIPEAGGGGTVYDETGLTFDVTATTSIIDLQNYIETVVVDAVATAELQDLQVYLEALSIPGVVSVFTNDIQTYIEDGTVNVVATVSVVDEMGSQVYDEPLTLTITSSVSVEDLQTWVEDLEISTVADISIADFRVLLEQLNFNVVSTVTGTEHQTYAENLEVAAAATVTLATLYQQAEFLSFVIDAFIEVVDLLDAPPTPSVMAGLPGGREGRYDRAGIKDTQSGHERQRTG